MSVHILTSGYWPTYPILEAKLPQELTQYQTVFKDFYLSKHSGRRLVWHNSLGTCTVRAHFAKGVKELSVSLFQVSSAINFSLTPFLSCLHVLYKLFSQKAHLNCHDVVMHQMRYDKRFLNDRQGAID